MAQIFIGLGANLGDPAETIKAALVELNLLPKTQLIRASSLYLSKPIDADGDDYVNAVAELETQLEPFKLLSELQALESRFGRTRLYQNAPRTLDLDLLLVDQLVISTPSLQIPHPRMTQRAFVMHPLLEIAPHIIIPLLGAGQTFLSTLQNQAISLISK